MSMSRIIRSAMLQMRVTPGVKRAADEILHRLGLNITEAVELFLRRVIVDKKLPFEVVAFDNATYKRIVEDWLAETPPAKRRHRTSKIPRRTA
jgi:addiction module RelB/DinJ family antitoxin